MFVSRLGALVATALVVVSLISAVVGLPGALEATPAIATSVVCVLAVLGGVLLGRRDAGSRTPYW